MQNDLLVETGAYALYRSENAHRIQEFAKLSNAEQIIAGDFQNSRTKYVRKFKDIQACLEAQGLAVTINAA